MKIKNIRRAGETEELLELSLSSPQTGHSQPQFASPRTGVPPANLSKHSRRQRSHTQNLKPGKSQTIPRPFPWATTRRAIVHSLHHLLSAGITKITGEVQCKSCEMRYEIEYDLQEKFEEVALFVAKNKATMYERAPKQWTNPTLPACQFCGQSGVVRPVAAEKKKGINWLFLLLGQMVGCCKLNELKYFCKHTKNHRTGAKNRLLYLTYLELCKQLQPDGPFDR
ncbi:hypothetical protein NMG60_11000426 [Bertholletia excelsa]